MFTLEATTITNILNLLLILVIMVGAGALGGFINYLMTSDSRVMPPEKPGEGEEAQAGKTSARQRRMSKEEARAARSTSIWIGIAAALLVPLFLKLIQSNLLENAVSKPLDLLVFGGFCLAAGIASKNFVRGVAERIANDARRLAESAAEEASLARQNAEQAIQQTDGITETVSTLTDTLGQTQVEQMQMQWDMAQAVAPLTPTPATETFGPSAAGAESFGITQPASPEEQLRTLEEKYAAIRQEVASSAARTVAMTQILRQMIELAPSLTDFDLSAHLSERKDIGRRLAGFAYFYRFPDASLLEALIQAVHDAEPFSQYWGIQAIGQALKDKKKSDLSPQTIQALESLLQSLKPGTDRHFLLSRILKELR